MEKVLKALGKLLIYILYVIVAIIIIGILRGIWKFLTDKY